MTPRLPHGHPSSGSGRGYSTHVALGHTDGQEAPGGGVVAFSDDLPHMIWGQTPELERTRRGRGPGRGADHEGPAIDHPVIVDYGQRRTRLAVALCVSTLRRSAEAPGGWTQATRREWEDLTVATLVHIPCPLCGSVDIQCPDSFGGEYVLLGRSVIRQFSEEESGYRVIPLVHPVRKTLANRLMDEHRGLTVTEQARVMWRAHDWRLERVYP